MAKQTTYNIATHFLDGGLILCNNIGEIDLSIYENFRFPLEDEESGEVTEIYQWFLTSWSGDDVKYLEETFGLLFTYSEKLDCYILCVDHWGTMWDGVPCDVLRDDWAKSNPDLLITQDNPWPKFKKIREY